MMSPGTLQALERWFHAYSGGFAAEDANRRRVIELKTEHCLRVRGEIREIAENAGVGPQEVRLAEAVGLLHDAGRFGQVARYGTFVDLSSTNHARLGVRVLRSEGVLERVERQARKIILIAVENHNKPEIPARWKGRALLHSRLIRDADKLDIYRILTGIYARRGKPAEAGDSVFLELPDEEAPGGRVVSERVYRNVLEGRVVPYAEIKNLNDFKLLQMGWVYDLNFPLSICRTRDRRFLEKIRESMPPSKMVDEVYDRVRSYLDDRCS
jgi:HD superfamily phosphohydrolase YqeK